MILIGVPHYNCYDRIRRHQLFDTTAGATLNSVNLESVSKVGMSTDTSMKFMNRGHVCNLRTQVSYDTSSG